MSDVARIRILLKLAELVAKRNDWPRAQQSAREALSGLEDDVADAKWESTRHLSEGMGGNDPGNARAAAMEAAE
jgi:hypothetical protein